MLLTSADKFYDLCVRPAVGNLNSSPDQIHFALSAILIVEAYSNWLAAETQKAGGSEAGSMSESDFKRVITEFDPETKKLFEAALALKHRYITRNDPKYFFTVESTESRPTGFGEAQYGAARYGGVSQVLMQTYDGDTCFVEHLVSRTINALHTTRQSGLVKVLEFRD